MSLFLHLEFYYFSKFPFFVEGWFFEELGRS